MEKILVLLIFHSKNTELVNQHWGEMTAISGHLQSHYPQSH